MKSGGTLSLQLINSYVPAPGDEFQILPGGGVAAGSFDNLQTNLGNGLFWDLSGLASTGTLRVAPEPGTAGLLALSVAALVRRRRAHALRSKAACSAGVRAIGRDDLISP